MKTSTVVILVLISFCAGPWVQSGLGADRPKEGYLIVVGDALAKSVGPFVKWKEKLGFKVQVATTTNTGKSAGEIKKYVQKVYDTWKAPSLSYVLLVGDIDTIPAHIDRKLREHPATDLNYSLLEGNDTTPDVGLGRLPARTPAEVKVMIDKIIYYEKGIFPSKDWLNRVSFVTPAAFYKLCEGTSEYCIKYTKKAGYTGMFPKKNQPGGDQLYAGTYKANTRNLASAFAQGRSIILYQGHGFEQGWANPRFGHREIRAIPDNPARPFVISVSCLTGRFDGKRDCIGETWMKHKNGAVAFFGASRNSLFPHCLQMQKGIFDAIFRDGKTTLSEICDAAERSIWKKYGNRGSKEMSTMYNLFGDPSMKLRIPESPTKEAKR